MRRMGRGNKGPERTVLWGQASAGSSRDKLEDSLLGVQSWFTLKRLVTLEILPEGGGQNLTRRRLRVKSRQPGHELDVVAQIIAHRGRDFARNPLHRLPRQHEHRPEFGLANCAGRARRAASTFTLAHSKYSFTRRLFCAHHHTPSAPSGDRKPPLSTAVPPSSGRQNRGGLRRKLDADDREDDQDVMTVVG